MIVCVLVVATYWGRGGGLDNSLGDSLGGCRSSVDVGAFKAFMRDRE